MSAEVRPETIPADLLAACLLEPLAGWVYPEGTVETADGVLHPSVCAASEHAYPRLLAIAPTGDRT